MILLKDATCIETGETLLVKYKQNNDPTIKQELTVRYSYLVKIIVRQMKGVYSSFADMDDMINDGIITLMDAIEHFDLTKNVKFETYASLRIRGAIIDVARKQDWVPRNVRRSIKEIDNAMSVLYNKYQRYPTDIEMAEYLNISLEKYLKLLADGNTCNILSLNELMINSQNENDINVKSFTEFYSTPEGSISKKERISMLKQAITNLKENEQKVISLYYSDEISMKEIANLLGLSESRVSQIHSKALLKLRHSLSQYIKD